LPLPAPVTLHYLDVLPYPLLRFQVVVEVAHR
jgi:hypothetical protein